MDILNCFAVPTGFVVIYWLTILVKYLIFVHAQVVPGAPHDFLTLALRNMWLLFTGDMIGLVCSIDHNNVIRKQIVVISPL